MLGNHCRDLGDFIFQKFSTKLASIGIKSWMMNICAILSVLVAFYFIIYYKIPHKYNFRSPHHIALYFLLFNHFFDYMDSGIDRARRFLHKRPFRYRKIFHITTDKLSEVIFLSGLALGGLTYWRHSIFAISTCILITLVGRWVDYKRVFDLDRSFFDRADRFFVIFISVWFWQGIFGTILISLMNLAGIIQRLVALFRARRPKLV